MSAALPGVHVAYGDTGWAAKWWLARVEQAETWVRTLGFVPHRIPSEGMAALVARKESMAARWWWQVPVLHRGAEKGARRAWLALHDPAGETTCLTGVRREESENRRDAPEHVTASDDHGGRELWQPLVRHNEAERDALVLKTPMPLLPVSQQGVLPVRERQKGRIETAGRRRPRPGA